MSYFGQVTMSPEEYLRKTGSDIPERFVEEPEPEHKVEVEYKVDEPAATPPKPVLASSGTGGLLLLAGLVIGAWLWMK